MNKLIDLTGSGWKGYVAGIGLMLYGVVIGMDACGIDVLPDVTSTMTSAIDTFLLGLGMFGLRHKLSQNEVVGMRMMTKAKR